MGSGGAWKCNFCGYEVGVGGPFEFYRDDKGQRKTYGHPVPSSKEAEEAGIKGFFELAYCPTCDKVQDVILVEFATPKDYFGAWSSIGKIKLQCPDCGEKLYKYLENLQCSRCRKGFFKLKMLWFS